MAMKLTSEWGLSNEMTLFIFSLLVLCALLGVSIATYACWRIFWKNAEELKSVDNITVNTATSCIILHALTVAIDPIAYLFFMTDNKSAFRIIWIIWDILWTLSKLNLYFVYIYRCYITFKDTKYAYSKTKVYIPLCIAWLIQLFNMVIFILHDIDDPDTESDDAGNPLSDDKVVIIVSSIYLVLDIFIILAVVYLFVHPIIRLLTDLRTKSSQHIELKTFDTSSKIMQFDDASSSSEYVIESTPHSPTKMGAAYCTKSNQQRNKKRNFFRQKSETQSIAEANEEEQQLNERQAQRRVSNTTKINPKLLNCGRLACPEDEEEEESECEEEEETKKFKFGLFGGKGKKTKDEIVWNDKQRHILNKGTRLALLSVIALSSGLVYQFLWLYSIAADELGNFSYSWGIDTVIGIVCIYLSFGFAEKEYNMICAKCCHCHGCCLKCMTQMAKKSGVY